jgi:selenocysteine lyase/cysteine desulfurase
VVTIEETVDGKVDLADLESKLSAENSKRSKSKTTLIGCFTAASNVTGQVTPL